jgi:hypothetical protein
MGGAQLVSGVFPRILRPPWPGSSIWSTRLISFGIFGLLREIGSKFYGETGRAFIVFV